MTFLTLTDASANSSLSYVKDLSKDGGRKNTDYEKQRVAVVGKKKLITGGYSDFTGKLFETNQS